jgi:tetratricopeptide (TPR) repeat protein
MNPTDPTSLDIDEFIERFERARGQTADADLAAFLPPPTDSRYAAVLRELVRVDLEFTWDHGARRRLEDYRARFPDLFDDPDGVRAVAWEECRLRRAAGERPTAAEYRSRFGIDLSDQLGPEPDGTQVLPRYAGEAAFSSTISPADTGFIPPIPSADRRYEPLAEIARGGMGTVYRAADRALDREVALKVLRDGSTAIPGAICRFFEEARIAGRLQHPGAPAVHDLGTLPDGRPFLAMRLVDGQTLADQLKARPQPAHDRGKFIAAFEQVCQTVGYAHSRGIVHRDLKPSNVMVGRFGEVQVMDWGLAKETRKSELGMRNDNKSDVPNSEFRDPSCTDDTQAGSVFGTPAYMPPEQARGENERVDERADVFGLGAILCEILTGQPPYVGPGQLAVAGMAARGDLAGAIQRLDESGAEPGLVELCKRCLRPDPNERPRTAGEVATEVTALRAAADDRARRAEMDKARAEAAAAGERKRRRAQLALGVSLFVLAGGASVSLWAYQRLAAERQADLRARAEDEQREHAAVTQSVRDAIEQTYRDVAGGRWTDARNSLARGADRLAAHPELPDDWAAMDIARADLDMGYRLEEARLARAARRPGVSEFDIQRTIAAYETAFERYGLTAHRLPPDVAAERIRSSRIAQNLVVAVDDWSAMLKDQSAREHLRAVARAADDDPWRNRLRDLRGARDTAGLAALARDPAALAQPPATIHLLAMQLAEKDRIGLLRAAQPLHPTDFWINHNLGVALMHQGRSGATDAVAPLTAAVALRPQSPGARVNLASAFIRKGEYEAAEITCRAALRLDPTDARIHQNLGVALRRQGKNEDAVAAYQEAIKIDPTDARSHTNLGGALQAVGDRPGAIAAFHEALRLNPADPLAHANLGSLSQSAGDLAGALAFWREAARLSPNDARTRLNMGTVLRELGDLAGAEAACREAIRLDPDSAVSHATLGSILRDRGDLDGAIAAQREAIRLDPRDYVGHFNLGNALRDRGDLTGAAAAYREAIRIDSEPIRGHLALGQALLEAGDAAGAVAAFRAATRQTSADYRAYLLLADALTSQGDLSGAASELQAAPDSPAIRAARARAERRLAMSTALPRLAAGTLSPRTPADALAAAEVSLLPVHRRYGLAYRLYSEMLAADPELPVVPTRYDAAGAAVQLAAGRDPGGPVDPAKSARLHEQARTWLKEAVAADPDARAARRRLLDPVFAPVREPAGLAALPPAEREAWERFWDELVRRAGSPKAAEAPAHPPVSDGEDDQRG